MSAIREMNRLALELGRVWARSDRLFGLVKPEAIDTRPIELRHPLIFYVGHLPAFAWLHVCRRLMDRRAFEPAFDEMFDRGIDPDVDDPARCHDHPDAWPALADVLAYRDRVRAAVLEDVDRVRFTDGDDVMAHRGRALRMAIEHELMHQETLLYMLQQLPLHQKVRPAKVTYDVDPGLKSGMIEVPAGTATLGVRFDRLAFGWDNEFPDTTVDVPAFEVDALPVTNGEFLRFVESGAYDAREFWTDDDFAWKTAAGLRHPLCWTRDGSAWSYRAMFDRLPLSAVRDWPVYVSLAEAQAYTRWRGARVMTEAEFHRAAYATFDGRERTWPWGETPPTPVHANLDFDAWSPDPVGSHPDGVSAWGVHELCGNGWEWTSTALAPFPGFRAYIPGYPGYSADFFDGKHYVLKGGSWATDARLVRPSYRNWFQARYPYVFAKFRCVSAPEARRAASATRAPV